MIQATVLKPIVTINNEICLAGDVVYLEGDKVFFTRRFLGRHTIPAKEIKQYFKIEKTWN